MPKPERIRRQQLLRHAEGYLELAMPLDEGIELAPKLRDRMVTRGLECLEGLEESSGIRGRVFSLRGQLLRISQQYDEAVVWLQKATDLEPDELNLYLALGWCYKRLDRIDLAIESLERALDVDDESGLVQYNLACYWALAAHVKLAIAHLAKAFDIQPQLRELVAEESDFDPIRHHPEFLAFTEVGV